jgi:L-amino acid N-acyltransferase YncA
MMKYASDNISITTFVAKIGEDNSASRTLFSSLGYKQVLVLK